MAGGDDRLSELPDDFLRRILQFVPLKEAASTTSLSRRWWAPLWLSSGAVNLETRLEDYDYMRERDALLSQRNALATAWVAALDTAEAPVTRLTLRLESDRDHHVYDFLHNNTDKNNHVVSCNTNMVDVVLSHREARRAEEVRLVARDCSCDYSNGEIIWDSVGLYKVNLNSLSWETLRLVELTNCRALYQWKALVVVLPRLSSLRLRHCAQHILSLQHIIDAAPTLTGVHLDSVIVDTTEEEHRSLHLPLPPHHLRLPVATVMVLERCRFDEALPGNHPHGYDDGRPVAYIAVEFEAPRLRHFKYKGRLRPFSFSPQPPELEQVDLHFFSNNDMIGKYPKRDLATFWRFARSFTSTKEMRLRVNHLKDIAVLSERMRAELLPAFHRLERLEVGGVQKTKGEREATSIANLLQCCPMLRDLRINLAMEHDSAKKDMERKFSANHDNFMGGPNTYCVKRRLRRFSYYNLESIVLGGMVGEEGRLAIPV